MHRMQFLVLTDYTSAASVILPETSMSLISVCSSASLLKHEIETQRGILSISSSGESWEWPVCSRCLQSPSILIVQLCSNSTAGFWKNTLFRQGYTPNEDCPWLACLASRCSCSSLAFCISPLRRSFSARTLRKLNRNGM